MTQQTVLGVHQIARPEGFPSPGDFDFVESPMPEPGAGQALVENLYWSVDPYHREAMNSDPLNEPVESRVVGRVVASRAPGLSEGDAVFHRSGWQTHAVVTPGRDGTRRIREHAGVPLSAHLGILGGTGLTAYVALTRILALRPGEDLYVSAAAGGVGTAAGRIARLLGAGRIVGSAGSPAKVAHLTEHLGYDAAFDHHDGDVTELLAGIAPKGVDACIDNVGGSHLEAAIASLRAFGRLALVGAVAQYNTTEPPSAPRNLFDVVGKSLRLEGVLVRNHTDAQEELEALVVPHLQDGRIASDETVVAGFERIVDAFIGLLRGENVGKMLVAR